MKFSHQTWLVTCALATALVLPGSPAHAESSLFGVAPEVSTQICDGKDHDDRWYQEVGDWLELSPAIFDKPVHSETRGELFGNPAFIPDTRRETCEKHDAYNEKLKELITRYYQPGNLHQDCENAAGLQRFIDRRLALFGWIAANDWNAPEPPAPTCSV
ncbi:hypothetical protein [Nocardia iowensis]|uniref:Secreted protein n=1 Tax=Nocardia iowensis TaxID=204891 RepID=A0ABX8S1U1_NOCIO|nr:hypothetical protein [Nocardia iowensis]QXN95057.1 hypothetical protein KV110_19640 [Nocardia iowensis]